MRNVLVILLIISLVSIPICAETILGLELYPDRMDRIFKNGDLVNGEEWFATTVIVETTFFDHLNIRFNIKTFLFGTNGFSYYPSSIKFTNSISYRFRDFKIKWEHFCHHYFKQYSRNPCSKQNQLIFKYSF